MGFSPMNMDQLWMLWGRIHRHGLTLWWSESYHTFSFSSYYLADYASKSRFSVTIHVIVVLFMQCLIDSWRFQQSKFQYVILFVLPYSRIFIIFDWDGLKSSDMDSEDLYNRPQFGCDWGVVVVVIALEKEGDMEVCKFHLRFDFGPQKKSWFGNLIPTYLMAGHLKWSTHFE